MTTTIGGSNPAIVFPDGTTQTTAFTSTPSLTTVTTTGAASFATSSGNVGVGTATPGAKFGVVSGSGSRQAQLGDISGYPAFICRDSDGATTTSGFWDATQQIFTNGGTERGRFDGSGNLLVGRTSSNYSGGSIEAYKYFSAGTFFGNVVGNDYVGSICYNPASAIQGISLNNVGTTTGQAIRFLVNGSQVGAISSTTTSTSYATSSDYRLKENIKPMQGALDKVSALKPVTYTWKTDGSDGEGFIAHELAEVCPQAVSGEKDAVDEDGNPKYQGIDTSFLVATLTAAIQELNAKFEEYKASHQ